MAKGERTQKDVAQDYFLLHSTNQFPIESVLLTDDGVFFPNTIKGLNNCQNYCSTAKVGFKEFKNDLL